MQQFAIYGVVGAVLIFAVWISIKTAVREAKQAGASEAKEKASEDAREAEQDMATAANKEPSAEETKSKLKDKTF